MYRVRLFLSLHANRVYHISTSAVALCIDRLPPV